jgi:hypothetical protein
MRVVPLPDAMDDAAALTACRSRGVRLCHHAELLDCVSKYDIAPLLLDHM